MSNVTFDGNDLLSGLKRLSQVKKMKDVTSLTYSMFPGTHCPLLGAILAIKGIADSLLLVVGTDECVYYSKNFTIHSAEFGGLAGRCVSVSLDRHDVTFGGVDKVAAAFKEIMEEYNPRCVFLVSTCIVEIIGDDFDALSLALSEEYSIPVLPIHTEHFKCEDHLPGIERALSACVTLMEKQVCNDSINILGQRMGNFNETELYQILMKEDCVLGVQLPGTCTLDEIRMSTAAKLNIVVNATALDLAKKMHKKFNIPYVYFDKFAEPDKIYAAYSNIFLHLGKDIPKEVEELYKKACKNIEKAQADPIYKNKSFIYGGAGFLPFEHVLLMCRLGLEPKLLQLSRIEQEDWPVIKEILQYYDPYVTRSANVTGLAHVYDLLQPDLNFGPAFSHILKEKNIKAVRYPDANNMLGFELSFLCIQGLEAACAQNFSNKEAV